MYRKIVPAFLIATLLAAVAPSAPAHASVPSPFSCRYTFIAWPGGFSADLYITNKGPAVDGWTARWTFETPTRTTAVWSGWLTQTGPHEAVAGPMSWNKLIRTDSVVAFGWTALAPATEVPTDITINGLPC